MTRKIMLTVILILLVFGCYELTFGKQEMIRQNLLGIRQLEASSKKLNTELAELERKSTIEYEQKKQQLQTTIQDYKTAKQEYEAIVPVQGSANPEQNIVKDTYDVAFLWTIIGNYATEEGIDMEMLFYKNTTSVSSLNNVSTDYIVCDLKFVTTGNYVNLTDFILDLENDDRLGFEINDFSMQKVEQQLQTTFTVKEVKVNATGFIETAPVDSEQVIENSTNTANTTNSTNTTNTTNTNNTTNTININQIN